MSSLKAARLTKATAYFLQHPEASISEVVRATGISERTVAQARSDLAGKGLVTPGRNRKAPAPLPSPPPAPPERPAEGPASPPTGGDTLLDDHTLRMIADPTTDLADLDLDDEATRKKLLREVKRIAFDTSAHPDTRLSATQVWLKLKDMAKSRELGPGVPLTRAAAIARLKDLVTAVGLDYALEALLAAFGIGPLVAALYKLLGLEKTDEGKVSADESETPLGPAGTGSAPSSEDHDGSAA